MRCYYRVDVGARPSVALGACQAAGEATWRGRTRTRSVPATDIRSNVPGHAVPNEQIGQDVVRIEGLQLARKALTGDLVNHIEQAEFPSVMRAFLEEVAAPCVMRMPCGH